MKREARKVCTATGKASAGISVIPSTGNAAARIEAFPEKSRPRPNSEAQAPPTVNPQSESAFSMTGSTVFSMTS